MKGEQAEYTIGLRTAFLFPPKKRIRKALNEIIRFVKKHTRAKEIKISNEVNEYLHLHSKNIPRKVKAVLLKEGEKVRVFMQEGKELKVYVDARDKAKKDKAKKKEEKEEKKKEAEQDTEQKEKLEEKKAKEKAAKSVDMKMKSGK